MDFFNMKEKEVKSVEVAVSSGYRLLQICMLFVLDLQRVQFCIRKVI